MASVYTDSNSRPVLHMLYDTPQFMEVPTHCEALQQKEHNPDHNYYNYHQPFLQCKSNGLPNLNMWQSCLNRLLHSLLYNDQCYWRWGGVKWQFIAITPEFSTWQHIFSRTQITSSVWRWARLMPSAISLQHSTRLSFPRVEPVEYVCYNNMVPVLLHKNDLWFRLIIRAMDKEHHTWNRIPS